MKHDFVLAEISARMARASCGIVVSRPPKNERPVPFTPNCSRRVRDVLYSVARDHRVPVEDILGKSRKRAIVSARHAAVWAVAEMVGWQPSSGNWGGSNWSSVRIAKLFGRDHTSILWILGRLNSKRKPPTSRLLMEREAVGA